MKQLPIIIFIFYTIFPQIVSSQEAALKSVIGEVGVEIIEKDKDSLPKVNINDIKYELSIDLEEVLVNKSGILTSESQYQTYTQTINSIIKSNPNISKNISYGVEILSKQANQQNNSGFTNIILRNEHGDKIEAKLKIENSNITFDKNGNADLNITSDFFFKNQQRRGKYKAFYYIVVSH